MASECFVYFIQSGKDGPVKIGSASCVKSRLRQLQTGNPVSLTLLLTLPGADKEERAFHDRFLDLMIRGEWFRYEGALVEFLEANGAKLGGTHRKDEANVSQYRRLKAKYPDIFANGGGIFKAMMAERRDRNLEIDRLRDSTPYAGGIGKPGHGNALGSSHKENLI